MMRRTVYAKNTVYILLVVVIATVVSVTGAQEEKAEENRARLRTIEQQLKKQKAEQKRIEREEQNALAGLNKINQMLKTYQQQLQKQKKTLAKNEQELKRTQTNLAQLQKRSNKKKTTLAKRLRAIYKMGDLGYLSPLFGSSVHTDVQQQIKYLQIFSENDVELINAARKDMQAVLKQKKALEDQQREIAQTQKEIKEQQTRISQQKQQQDQLLQRLRQDKQQFAMVIRKLEVSAAKLEKFLQDLETASRRTVQNSKKQEKTARQVTFPNNVQTVVKSYGRHFRANKGKLLWPVQGKIITNYGKIKIDGTKTYTFHKGVNIQAKKGTPFYSVFKGTVKYADWFNDYGNLIIIDHGGNYYTLYAHADELAVNAGDTIETRQVLGNVGDTDSIKGPLLYFEVRANGKPDNPQKWLAKVR